MVIGMGREHKSNEDRLNMTTLMIGMTRTKVGFGLGKNG